MIAQNPRILEILEKYEIPLEINLSNVKEIKETHLNSTEDYAKGIAEELKQQFNLSKADRDIISKGAIFHDYGKILIPAELLNKAGKLSPEEKRIVDLHSVLGYELLKTTNLDPQVLEIVKNHHRPLDKGSNLNTQIVSAADVYSALRTKRSYKDSMSEEQAMEKLDKYAERGKIDPEVINALKQYVNKQELATT